MEGLPTSTTEAEIAAHFGSIGIIKIDKKKEKPKIWCYTDKSTGSFKVHAASGRVACLASRLCLPACLSAP